MAPQQPKNVPTTAPTSESSKPIVGRDTGYMLESMGRAYYEVPKTTPLKDPTLVQGLLTNAEITTMVKEISDLQDERDSIYRVQSQVASLAPNLDSNTLIKPETKSQLKVRINNLSDLVNQGLNMDSNFTMLEAKAVELKDQLTQSLKAFFRVSKKPSETPPIDSKVITQSIKERAQEADRLSRSFMSLHQQIERTYTETRDALPGTGPLNLKPFTSLTAPKTEVTETPSTPKLK